MFIHVAKIGQRRWWEYWRIRSANIIDNDIDDDGDVGDNNEGGDEYDKDGDDGDNSNNRGVLYKAYVMHIAIPALRYYGPWHICLYRLSGTLHHALSL